MKECNRPAVRPSARHAGGRIWQITALLLFFVVFFNGVGSVAQRYKPKPDRYGNTVVAVERLGAKRRSRRSPALSAWRSVSRSSVGN